MQITIRGDTYKAMKKIIPAISKLLDVITLRFEGNKLFITQLNESDSSTVISLELPGVSGVGNKEESFTVNAELLGKAFKNEASVATIEYDNAETALLAVNLSGGIVDLKYTLPRILRRDEYKSLDFSTLKNDYTFVVDRDVLIGALKGLFTDDAVKLTVKEDESVAFSSDNSFDASATALVNGYVRFVKYPSKTHEEEFVIMPLLSLIKCMGDALEISAGEESPLVIDSMNGDVRVRIAFAPVLPLDDDGLHEDDFED